MKLEDTGKRVALRDGTVVAIYRILDAKLGVDKSNLIAFRPDGRKILVPPDGDFLTLLLAETSLRNGFPIIEEFLRFSTPPLAATHSDT